MSYRLQNSACKLLMDYTTQRLKIMEGFNTAEDTDVTPIIYILLLKGSSLISHI
jgi:hypothetical protein